MDDEGCKVQGLASPSDGNVSIPKSGISIPLEDTFANYRCGYCGTTKDLHPCRRCRKQHYCGQECQIAHSKEHQKPCILAVQAYNDQKMLNKVEGTDVEVHPLKTRCIEILLLALRMTGNLEHEKFQCDSMFNARRLLKITLQLMCVDLLEDYQLSLELDELVDDMYKARKSTEISKYYKIEQAINKALYEGQFAKGSSSGHPWDSAWLQGCSEARIHELLTDTFRLTLWVMPGNVPRHEVRSAFEATVSNASTFAPELFPAWWSDQNVKACIQYGLAADNPANVHINYNSHEAKKRYGNEWITLELSILMERMKPPMIGVSPIWETGCLQKLKSVIEAAMIEAK